MKSAGASMKEADGVTDVIKPRMRIFISPRFSQFWVAVRPRNDLGQSMIIGLFAEKFQ